MLEWAKSCTVKQPKSALEELSLGTLCSLWSDWQCSMLHHPQAQPIPSNAADQLCLWMALHADDLCIHSGEWPWSVWQTRKTEGWKIRKAGNCSDKRGSASPGISHSVLSAGRVSLVRAETVEKHFVLSPAVSSLALAVSSLTLLCMKLN